MSAITGFVTNIKATAKTLGTQLPPEIGAAVDKAQQVVAKADAITASRAALLTAVLDAIEQGRDYKSDKRIHGLMLDFMCADQNIGSVARQRSDDAIGAALVEAADTILEAWDAALQPHTAKLIEAAEQLLSDDLSDLASVKSGGVAAFTHLGHAEHAVTLWAAAIVGFRQLALAARVDVPNRTAILTADDAAGLPPDVWLLARRGIDLSLPTLGEYVERCERAGAARETASVAP